jgi:hypothetical protein
MLDSMNLNEARRLEARRVRAWTDARAQGQPVVCMPCTLAPAATMCRASGSAKGPSRPARPEIMPGAGGRLGGPRAL